MTKPSVSPMSLRRWAAVLAGAAASAALAACSSPVKLDPPAPVENRSVTGGAGATGAGAAGTTGAAPQSQVATVDAGKTTGVAVENTPRIVYFDFDSYVVKDEYKNVVESNAKMLSTNRNKRMLIEGHTDERGGSEYNLALGQRRAEAVARSLALLGVQATQVEAVSFGKERPAVQGGSEEAWAKNRRAELRDR
jgi:peptidoglycan-associated lipoprotein